MSETLHTVEIELSMHDTMRLLDEAQKRPNGAMLICGEIDISEGQHMTLVIDGEETATRIFLDSNGTWTASTHISLGLKVS